MESEDFSFPRINDTSSNNIDSPPLWNLSTTSSPNPYQGNQMKSFSCIEIGRKIIALDDEENKMDLLWEDFNEQLSSTTGSTTEFRSWTQALTVATKTKSKTNALVPSKNKPAMVVIFKVLKKIFSINNNLHGRQRKRVR